MESIVVLGLGNVLYGDEGLGVHAVQRLHSQWDFPAHVNLVDGGTQGHSLLTYVEDARRLLVLDAVDFGLSPGEVVVKSGEDIPRYLTGHKVSPHQNSFSEVLALAQLRDALPDEMVLIGMQPVRMKLGEALTPQVESRLELLANLALEQLCRWDVQATPTQEARSLYHPGLSTIMLTTPAENQE